MTRRRKMKDDGNPPRWFWWSLGLGFLVAMLLAFGMRNSDDAKKEGPEQAIIIREAKRVPVAVTVTGWIDQDYASSGKHFFPGCAIGGEVEIGPDGRGTIKMAGAEYMQLKGEVEVQKR